MKPIDIHIGGVLQRKREAIAMTMLQAAAATGIDIDVVMRLENGRQRASAMQLFKLCRLYGLTPADLYRDAAIEPDETPPEAKRQ